LGERTEAHPTVRPAARHAAPLLVLGFLVLQLAWLLTTPPYAGSDEVDHAYRAQGVALGQVVAPQSSAAYGTGALVTVPLDVVEAAEPLCKNLPYTEAVNCEVPRDATGEFVTMPSSAGRYSPLYYAVAGGAGLPFDGYDALYAMRTASILLCTAFFALAVWCLRRTARGPLPCLALVVATTPIVLYSTTIVAPNGLEISAAVALWCALLGLRATAPAPGRGLAVAAVVAACVLATSRALGPLWLVLALGAVLALDPPSTSAGMVRSWLRSRGGLVGCATVVVATLGGIMWTLGAHALEVGHDGNAGITWETRLRAVESIPLWVLQSMAAFPNRNDPSPAVAYLCLLVALAGVLALAWGSAAHRERRVLVAVAALGLLIPLAVSVATVSTYGMAWQGRYTLPLTVGVPLVAGYLLSGRAGPRAWWAAAGLAGLVGVAQVVCLADYHRRQLATSPLSGDPAWLTAPTWMVTGVALLGAVLMVAGVVSRGGAVDVQRLAR